MKAELGQGTGAQVALGSGTAARGHTGASGVIVRISTEAQYELSDADINELNELDNAVVDLLRGIQYKVDFRDVFAALLKRVRTKGVLDAEDRLAGSDAILPPPDISLDGGADRVPGRRSDPWLGRPGGGAQLRVDRLCGSLPAEPRSPHAAGCAEPLADGPVDGGGQHRLGQRSRVIGIDELRRRAAGLRQRSPIGGDDWCPARHRLQAGQPEALIARRQHERPCAVIEARQLRIGDIRRRRAGRASPRSRRSMRGCPRPTPVQPPARAVPRRRP